MKKALLLLTLAFTCISSFAQINFEPGYFINNDGIKTQCLIRNAGWESSPVSFDYKTAEGADTQTAALSTFTEFGVSGYIFKRFTVNIDRASSDYDNMSLKKDPDFKQETVLLRVLADGKASLYSYKDTNLVRYFYSKNGSQPEQFVYKPYRDGTTIGYNNSFKGQLYKLMSDAKLDTEVYKNTDYDTKDLTTLFLKYNGATAAEIKSYTTTEGKTSFNIKITPGVSFTSSDINFMDDDDANYDLGTKPVFRIGAEAEWVMPFNRNKWSVFIDPNYSSYKDSAKSTVVSAGNESYNEWSISYQTLSVPLGVRHYIFLNNNAKIFINTAYQFNFVLNDSKAVFNYGNSFNHFTNIADAGNSANFIGGAGFSYKKYSIEFRYNFKREILVNYARWNGSSTSLGIILGYKLF